MPAKRTPQVAASPTSRSPWMKLGVIAIVIAGAAFAAFPLKDKIDLGLDLQGGTYLVLEVHLDEAVASSGERVISSVRSQLATKGVTPQRMVQERPGRLTIDGIPEASRADADDAFATMA